MTPLRTSVCVCVSARACELVCLDVRACVSRAKGAHTFTKGRTYARGGCPATIGMIVFAT